MHILISINIELLFDEWNVIQDDWIKIEVVMTYNRSVVDNLVPTIIEETLPKFSKKKSHNFRHITQYLTLLKKCWEISWYYNLRVLQVPTSTYTKKTLIIAILVVIWLALYYGSEMFSSKINKYECFLNVFLTKKK